MISITAELMNLDCNASCKVNKNALEQTEANSILANIFENKKKIPSCAKKNAKVFETL